MADENTKVTTDELAEDIVEDDPDRTVATPIFTNASGGGTSWNLVAGEFNPSGGSGEGGGGDMSIEALKALMGKPYGLLLIMFDNDEFWYFTNDEDGQLTEDNFEVVNDIEFVKRKDYIYSKRGGPNGGISKADIPVWLYKPISMIQGVMLLENKKDLKYVDRGRLFTV